MNFQLRHSIKWQMIGPIPLMVIAAIAAVWFTVPRLIADNATNQALLAGRIIAAQFKTLREYYTESVVDKVISGGTFKASSDHKGDAKAIPLPATMILDLSAMFPKSDVAVNLYSKFPFPNRGNRPLDAFQQEAWDFLVRNPEETYSRQEMLDGRHVVRVAVWTVLPCHVMSRGRPTLTESKRAIIYFRKRTREGSRLPRIMTEVTPGNRFVAYAQDLMVGCE